MLSGPCFSTVREDRFPGSWAAAKVGSCLPSLEARDELSGLTRQWLGLWKPILMWERSPTAEVSLRTCVLNHSDARAPYPLVPAVGGVCVGQSVASCSSPVLFISLPWSVSRLWSHTIGIDDFVYFHQILTLQLSFKEGETKQARGG